MPKIQNSLLTTIFSFITIFGEWYIILTITFIAILIFIIIKKRNYIIPILITVVGSGIFTQIAKIIIKRPRPHIIMHNESSFSFPSGHSAISLALYGFIAFFIIKNYKKINKNIVITICSTIIILIGLSRIYLGVHYASDVIGGYLTGIIWLTIGIKSINFIKKH